MTAQEFTNYTIKDGLPSNHIYRVTQDEKGFLWIVTDRGISKFNGTTFKNFTTKDGLPTNDIWNIRITPDQKVWYFSKSDQLGYIKNDSVFKFPSIDEVVMYPIHLDVSGNKVGFIELNYSYSLNEKVWRRKKIPNGDFPLNNMGLHMKVETSNYVIKKDDSTIYSTAFLDAGISVMRTKLNDSIFIAISDRNALVFNSKTNKGKQINYQDEGLDTIIKHARFHQVNDNFQFTGQNFLATLDNSFNRKASYNLPVTLDAHFSFLDKQGNIWAATFNNGLYRLPANFNTLRTKFNTSEIELLQLVDNTLFVGTKNKGIYEIKDNKVKLFNDDNSYSYGVFKSGDSILVPYQTETLIVDKNKKRKLITSNIFKRGKRFLVHNETLWSDGFSSLYKYHPGSLEPKVFSSNYNYLFAQDGKLFTFQNKKLQHYDEVKDVFNDFGNFKVKSKIRSIKTSDNKTYIGTEGDGLYVFKNDKLIKIIEDDKNFISGIAVENQNSIWVIVHGELQQYVIDNEKKKMNRFPQINGFATSNLTRLAIKDDILYLGSDNGLHEFSLTDISTNLDFELYIDEISINQDRISGGVIKTKYTEVQNIRVNYGVLQFNGVKPQYAYRVLPDGKKWNTTDVGVVNVSNLRPGTYTLQLRATINNVEKLKDVEIIILPLWYQTALFKICTALLLFLVFGYIVFKITRISENKKRDRLAQEKRLSEIQLKALRTQMNPHFVFNSLAAIQYFFNENEIDKGDDYLVKFSRLIRQFFELADKKEIKISEEKQLLTNYLDVEKLRFRDKFEYKIEVPKELESSAMPSMLLQPIVENSINHGIFNKETNGKVNINFKTLENNTISISIIDDGVGFKRTQKAKELRLKSSSLLEERLFYLNQTGDWDIIVSSEDAFPEREDCGHKTTFIIKSTK